MGDGCVIERMAGRGDLRGLYICVYLVYVCLLRDDVFVSYGQFVLLIDQGWWLGIYIRHALTETRYLTISPHTITSTQQQSPSNFIVQVTKNCP